MPSTNDSVCSGLIHTGSRIGKIASHTCGAIQSSLSEWVTLISVVQSFRGRKKTATLSCT